MMNQDSKEDSDAENSVKVILQHTSGWDPERKMKKAHDLFEESIRFHCGRNGRKIDKISSRKLAMQASALGHRSALAECYYRGWGVKQSYDMAVEICREEAKEGIAYAQFKLGVCYERGRGVEKNEAKAVEWYSKAAAQDHISACGNLGVCYEEGAGVTRDMNKALLYYEKAANKGDILAYFNLGMNHEDHDVEKAKKWDKESLRESVMWYTKAAEQGSVESMEELARYYEKPQLNECSDNALKLSMHWYYNALKKNSKFAVKSLSTDASTRQKAMHFLESQRKDSLRTIQCDLNNLEMLHESILEAMQGDFLSILTQL
eukprot:jgi/Bigna1/145386/aug1.98_g20094